MLYSGLVALFSIFENGLAPVVVPILVPVPVGVRVNRVSGGASFDSVDDLFYSAGLSVAPSGFVALVSGFIDEGLCGMVRVGVRGFVVEICGDVFLFVVLFAVATDSFECVPVKGKCLGY